MIWAVLALALPMLTAQVAVCREPASPRPPASRQAADVQDAPIPAPSDSDGGLEDRELTNSNVSSLYGLLQTLLALALVIGLIFAVRFLLKRYGPASPGGRSGAVELLINRPVGPKNRLLLVRFGRRLLLLGSGPSGLSTLCEASDPQETAAILEGGEGSFK